MLRKLRLGQKNGFLIKNKRVSHFNRQIIFKRLNNSSKHIQEAFYIGLALFIYLSISDLCFLHFSSPSNVAHKMYALIDNK